MKFKWQEPKTLSKKFLKEMKEMLIDSLVTEYRASTLFSQLSDFEIRNRLEEHFDKAIIPRLANSKEQYFLYAQANAKLIGFALWEKLDNQQVYLAELAIAKDYWRQGLGKRFLQSIFYKLPNTKKILVVTRHEYKSAQLFYEALGYKPSDYMHPGYPAKNFCAYELVIN